ncbi:double-strand break repair protein MRE11 [Maniola hyperantus]|uniref:double-strand break repair protein MRE11 n=1 Tax=Aphantopus hyperantus TaxID=2795564 RepID=UPI001567D0D2|nr:double-strand break repair protein MRE11 [Maniola hyperantus]
MVQNDNDSWSPDDTIRVLIASDIHLGHLENDDVRGEDSFIAFEEVLSLAVQYDVDLVLLGGDLFDHAKPSPSCMFKCTQIIRKYCFGDKPINIEVLSDQFENFSRAVNYEDPNLNVSYPILSIHGNHDDPVGQDGVSSLDILSITGLVNYFGRWTDYTHVRISPVLIRKGDTKLSLYGLSHIKDQRLARLFLEKKVEMDLVEDGNDWFNVLALHQNRADRGHNNFIPENVLPTFLDLVVWGHEHDSQVFATKDIKRESGCFSVIQPGSTVATSLAAGEALPKHCALLQLHRKEYIVTPLPLKTVRPFIFKTVVLSEENLDEEDVNEKEKVQNFLKEKVNQAIAEAESLRSGDPKQPLLPLIRLSVFFEHEGQDFNRVRFCQNFNGLVANPKDILIMKREKKVRERKERAEEEEDVDMSAAAVEATDVEALLRAYYAALPAERRLAVLSVRAVTDAVRDFTLKRDDDVFRRTLDAHRQHAVEHLLKSGADTPAEVDEQLRLSKAALDAVDEEGLRALITQASAAAAAGKKAAAAKQDSIVVSSDEEPPPPTRGRGRGARGNRARRGRGPARAAKPSPPPSPPPERRSTPRRSAAQKTTSWLQTLNSERATRRRRDSSDIEISDD